MIAHTALADAAAVRWKASDGAISDHMELARGWGVLRSKQTIGEPAPAGTIEVLNEGADVLASREASRPDVGESITC